MTSSGLSMQAMLQIARREFLATVMTKGFLIAILLVPAMFGFGILVIPRLLLHATAAVTGEIAIVDPTGETVERVRARLTPAAFVERRRAMLAAIGEMGPRAATVFGGNGDSTAASMARLMGEAPQLSVVALANDADLEKEKALLKTVGTKPRRLAVIVIQPNAVIAPKSKDLGNYVMYVRGKLDDQLLREVGEGVDRAIVDGRLAHRALDAADIRALTRVQSGDPVVVDERGEKEDNQIAAMFIPMAFMMLMLLSIMTAGGQLLTSTVEEKSSRVVELLLAAVSPTELMAGKILGQMGVSTLMLGLYGGLGLLGLVSFAALGLLAPIQIVYLLILFIIGFVMMSAMMAGIGSAVSEMRDAQALLTPVMLVNILPMILWMPISTNPNSAFATALSFVPPVSPFVILLRVTARTPPPTWEVVIAIVVAAAFALGLVWFAGRVFRVGLLMQGKPPNLATLVRWARMG